MNLYSKNGHQFVASSLPFDQKATLDSLYLAIPIAPHLPVDFSEGFIESHREKIEKAVGGAALFTRHELLVRRESDLNAVGTTSIIEPYSG